MRFLIQQYSFLLQRLHVCENLTEGKEMFCSKCGNEIYDEAVICPKCGCPTENYNKTNNNKETLNKDLTFADLKKDPNYGKKMMASIFYILTIINMFNPLWQVTQQYAVMRVANKQYMYKSFVDWSDTFGIVILVFLVTAIACMWIKKRMIALISSTLAMLVIMYVSVEAVGVYGSISFWGAILIITSICALISTFMIKE